MINPGKLLKMQYEAKQMQKRMREKKIYGESKDGKVKIYMNMAQEFEDIYIDESILSQGSLDLIKKGMEEAFKDYQKRMQKEAVKDLDLNQLRDMLG